MSSSEFRVKKIKNDNITVEEEKNDKTSYAFWKVSYHNIDFSSLTEVSK